MKIVGIGDLLIPCDSIIEGFRSFEKLGAEITAVEWKLKDFEELQNINLRVEQRGSEIYEASQEILNAVKDADIIITHFCTITRRMIDNCPNLKAVGVLRSGFENINVEYASEKKIHVFHTPGRNANAVADFTVGMMISECRNIAKSHRKMKEGKWVRDFSNAGCVPDLCDKTVGIIGMGVIGKKVAKRLQAFEMKIIGYDPYVDSNVSEYPMVSLEELMTEADFVTVHSRLTKDTKGLISREMISLMKSTAYFINTARAGLVDEDALCEALNSREIAGAALDVFEEEPPGIDYKLVIPENVTLTPHMAGGTRDAFLHSPYLLAEEMLTFYREHKMSDFLVNKDIYREQFEQEGQ